MLADGDLIGAEAGAVDAGREVKGGVQSDRAAILWTQKAVGEVLQGDARHLDTIEHERLDAHGTGFPRGSKLSGDRDVVLAGEKRQERTAAAPVGSEAIKVNVSLAMGNGRLTGNADIGEPLGQFHSTLVEIRVPFFSREHGRPTGWMLAAYVFTEPCNLALGAGEDRGMSELSKGGGEQKRA